MRVMEKDKRKPYDPICPGGIIQGNPMLKAVVNPDNRNAHIFFSHDEFTKHCTHDCKKIRTCTEEHQKAIVKIFRSYNKPVSEN